MKEREVLMGLAALCWARTRQQQMQIIVLMVFLDQLVHKAPLVIQACLLLGLRVTKEEEDVVVYEDTGAPKAYKEYR